MVVVGGGGGGKMVVVVVGGGGDGGKMVVGGGGDGGRMVVKEWNFNSTTTSHHLRTFPPQPKPTINPNLNQSPHSNQPPPFTPKTHYLNLPTLKPPLLPPPLPPSLPPLPPPPPLPPTQVRI